MRLAIVPEAKASVVPVRLVVDAVVAVRLVAVALTVRRSVVEAYCAERFVAVAFVARRSVMEAERSVEEVAKRLVVVALKARRFVTDAVCAVKSVAVVDARVVTPRNVLFPAKIWVVVETRPRAVAEASGMLK